METQRGLSIKVPSLNGHSARNIEKCQSLPICDRSGEVPHGCSCLYRLGKKENANRCGHRHSAPYGFTATGAAGAYLSKRNTATPPAGRVWQWMPSYTDNGGPLSNVGAGRGVPETGPGTFEGFNSVVAALGKPV